ncbi:M48 family metallopeptidase [Candidatus Dependentiae bacterium]|nr:M48 family metallopeptidase [Candidatus Dependentiae bacterium]
MKKNIILLLLLVGMIQAAVKEQCMRMLPHLLFVAPALYTLHKWTTIEKKIVQHFEPMQDKKVAAFLEQECATITPQKIRFFVGRASLLSQSLGETPACATSNNIIILHPDYYAMIQNLFAQETLTEQDQGTLNILRFIVQHEAMHIRNHDPRNRVITDTLLTLIEMAAFQALANRFFATKKSSVAGFVAAQTIDVLLSSWYYKWQEKNADAGVRGAAALQGGKILFANLLAECQMNPGLYICDEVLNFSHPTIKSRLQRIEERIQEQQAAYQAA